jgi:hypothetical protein
MHRPLVIAVALAAVVGGALFARVGEAGDVTRFRTPDAGAACKLEGAVLVCQSLASNGSLALRSAGQPNVVRRLPWWDASTPVLKRWRHGGVECALESTSIVCRNGEGAISVSGAGFAVTAYSSPRSKASSRMRISQTARKPRRSRIGRDILPAWVTRRGVPRATASSQRAATSAR